MRFIRSCATALCLYVSLLLEANGADELVFQARTRQEAPGGSSVESVKDLRWDPRQTAAIICDMWQDHWCEGAAARVVEMAPRANEFVSALRRRGVLIIHCPSGGMDYYEVLPQRRLARNAPPVVTREPIDRWTPLEPRREPLLPIDDSDGGCDEEPKCEGRIDPHQTSLIPFGEGDAITDSAEAYYLMHQRGIRNVIVLGVHTNICVLARPFAIRRMAMLGQNVVLVRDLTDTMYNSRRWPLVSHFQGTDLVIGHIERHWCPTIGSEQVLGGRPFRFRADVRPKVVFALAEPEYRTHVTVPLFARDVVEARLGCEVRILEGDPARQNLRGLAESLATADLLFLSVRRQSLAHEEMAALHAYLEAGKPLIGIRTASHAFAPRGPVPPGHVAWPAFDPEVLGGNYQGHHGSGPRTSVTPLAAAAEHPILAGIVSFESIASLYRAGPLAPGASPLLSGRIPGAPAEPVAWTHHFGPSKVFYTSLGHEEDFSSPQFVRLLSNGVRWALGRPVPIEPEDLRARWHLAAVPGAWEDGWSGALGRFDGFASYRTAVNVPASWEGKDLALSLGAIDDCDETRWNGEIVGRRGGFPPEFRSAAGEARFYSVPARLVRPGAWNLITVRVYDGGERGGFKTGGQSLSVSGERLSLEGRWQFRAGDVESGGPGSVEEIPASARFERK